MIFYFVLGSLLLNSCVVMAITPGLVAPRVPVHFVARRESVLGSSQPVRLRVPEISIDDMSACVVRLPMATFEAMKSALSAFISTIALITPIGMLWHIKSIRTPKVWIQKGYTLGKDWGRTSAFFLGGEVLSEKLRGKKDRWNRYVGSGLGSATLRIDEGPISMLNGFLFGFGFLYAFDTMSGPAGDQQQQQQQKRAFSRIPSSAPQAARGEE